MLFAFSLMFKLQKSFTIDLFSKLPDEKNFKCN